MKRLPLTGAQLRQRRRKAGIPLAYMAAHLEISAPYLYDVEHGSRRLTDERRKAYLEGIKYLKEPTAG